LTLRRVSAFIMSTVQNLFERMAVLALAIMAVMLTAAAPFLPPTAARDQISIDFSGPVAAIDLKDLLTPYNAPAGKETDGSRWYLVSATNGSVRPVTRVLMAADPPNAALHIFPRKARPQIVQVASSDSGVTVERLRAIGRHSFLVSIPPATSVSLAIRVAYGDDKPSVVAWNEPALVAHNRQVAIFLAAVAGLIAAAAAIMAGVAIITVHPAPGWAAVVLIFDLLICLYGAEVLDAGWTTSVGGPYGMGAMLAGLAFAAALRLTAFVAPFAEVRPSAARWRQWLPYIIVAISLAAFLGVPAATVTTDSIVAGGTVLIAAYLVQRGLAGSRAARVVAPSAIVFALVAAATVAAALGAFQQNPMASGIIGGFTAAGAVLLALAIAAGEGIAILPLARGQTADTPAAPARADSTVAQAIGAALQGVFDLDLAANRLRLSREATWILGMNGVKAMPHAEWIERVHPEDRDVYVEAINEYRTQPGLAFRMEFRAQSEGKRYPWFELRATMLGKSGRGRRCLGLLADITARKEAELAQPVRTTRDSLTGLGNRIALVEELENQADEWNGLAFAILDIDRFKSIHASLGDTGGDQLLAALAIRLEKKFSAQTHAFRIGGDSFALVVPHAADYGARLGAELTDVCTAPFSVGGRNVFASASVGVALGRDTEDALDLIRAAEVALAQAKRQGGGSWKVFTREMAESVSGDAVVLETDLRRALNQNEFAVYYQPIVRLADGSVAGFEALLRWRHPERGLVSPAEFIAHSEETGLIVALGRFALERTASDLAGWQRYFPVEPPLFASVNVSKRQLRDQNFSSSVEKLLSAGGFRDRTFKLEITESAVEANANAKCNLERLRDLGAGLAIDDFGTGVSTLSQLKDLPFDTVKIDRSFLARHGGAQDTGSAAVVSSVIALAHELNRTVIAEGVETEADAVWLKHLGCEFAQGFYFSPPLSPEDALNFIATHFRADASAELMCGQPDDGDTKGASCASGVS
jgi:diguanylate cyclase (GGDEF)-like protein/PAS domain S-box-containing protein